MFYKVVKDNKVIDLLEHLTFIKYSDARKKVILCNNRTAQGIISSNGETFWHVNGFHPFPMNEYESVDLYEIDEKNYLQLKALNGKTPEEIIDNYTLYLIEEGLL